MYEPRTYRIWRRSGRASERFSRLVLETPDGERAYRNFHWMAESIRQGAVTLVEPDGRWKQASAPALRTRW